jgi:hypothetical protein
MRVQGEGEWEAVMDMMGDGCKGEGGGVRTKGSGKEISQEACVRFACATLHIRQLVTPTSTHKTVGGMIRAEPPRVPPAIPSGSNSALQGLRFYLGSGSDPTPIQGKSKIPQSTI